MSAPASTVSTATTGAVPHARTGRRVVSAEHCLAFSSRVLELVLQQTLNDPQVRQLVVRKLSPKLMGLVSELAPNHKSAVKKVDPNAPRKPATAYLVFQKDNYEKVSLEHGVKGKAVSTKCSAIWSTMSEEDKSPYVTQHREANEKYQELLKNYVPAPVAEVVVADAVVVASATDAVVVAAAAVADVVSDMTDGDATDGAGASGSDVGDESDLPKVDGAKPKNKRKAAPAGSSTAKPRATRAKKTVVVDAVDV